MDPILDAEAKTPAPKKGKEGLEWRVFRHSGYETGPSGFHCTADLSSKHWIWRALACLNRQVESPDLLCGIHANVAGSDLAPRAAQ